MEENLGNRVSADTISSITDRVLPEIKAWKSRMLDSVYPIVWMDAIHYKVTDERGCAVTRAIYNVLGIDREGHKELLGMYISRNEGANFWLSVLTDLQNRGVEDILIACIDGLKGFPEAIQSVYPNTAIQLCVVHQIRNSIKYVGSKNQKEFLKDLKCVYQAVNKESAENELLKLEEKWGEQYPVVIRSWQENWDKLSEYFQYTPAIRKLIYTTNTVEGYHRQIRKVTKNKGVFPSDTALEKLVYLAYRNIRKKVCRNTRCAFFFFVDYKNRLIFLSCDILRISSIYVFAASKYSYCKLIKQSSQPIHTFFSHFCTYLFYIEGNGKEGKVHEDLVLSKMAETFVIHIVFHLSEHGFRFYASLSSVFQPFLGAELLFGFLPVFSEPVIQFYRPVSFCFKTTAS